MVGVDEEGFNHSILSSRYLAVGWFAVVVLGVCRPGCILLHCPGLTISSYHSLSFWLYGHHLCSSPNCHSSSEDHLSEESAWEYEEWSWFNKSNTVPAQPM